MTRTDEIKARLDAATPRPWRAINADGAKKRTHQKVGQYLLETRVSPADISFLENAPSDIEHLLAENTRLREALEDIANARPDGEIGGDGVPFTDWELAHGAGKSGPTGPHLARGTPNQPQTSGGGRDMTFCASILPDGPCKRFMLIQYSFQFAYLLMQLD